MAQIAAVPMRTDEKINISNGKVIILVHMVEWTNEVQSVL